ncbi:MAG: RidA family protein [Saprospiraceae bacterium]|nr:RidA family protein [Saprospiraceae bacterium]
MTPTEKFNALGYKLPPPPAPKGVYKPCLIDGNYLYVSGHGPVREDGSLIFGRVGSEVDKDYAKNAALHTGLTILSSIVTKLGSLDRIKKVIKVLGMVNAEPDFGAHPYVINGCSELFAAIWGEEDGIGVRSAVGMGSLPENITVEIEALFLIH